MIVLTRDQLEQILKTLPEYYPKSLQLDAIIRNRLAGSHVWPGTEIVADKFPDYSVILQHPIKGSHDYLPCPEHNSVTLFCRDISRLEDIVRRKDFVDWSKGVEFFAVSRHDVYPCLWKQSEELENSVENHDSEEPDGIDLGIVHLLNPSYLVKSEVPEGFRLGEIPECYAEQCNREWHYGTPNSLSFFKHILRDKFPASGIFTQDDRLVAYIFSCEGGMFNGYVHPEYRGRGLYQVVNYDLAGKLVALGQPCSWLFVKRWNEPSLNSYRKLGAKKVHPDEFAVAWFEYEPKK
ncbi:hypothetical protein BV898_16906 [Hypsibius exemplaris]|uniref:Glycine N-acyltransferase-like protein n=1 Tax=Hypsibius exemplaris TaxID=2072580 RepID=A0A9X6NE19_HYPEX|nr:hypothetical protein BV898_16906 [Hypsibius exemplaris]